MCCLEENRVGLKYAWPGFCGVGSMLIYKVDTSTHILQRLSFSEMGFVASTSVVLMQGIKMNCFCWSSAVEQC